MEKGLFRVERLFFEKDWKELEGLETLFNI
jgi:hypothetical protein